MVLQRAPPLIPAEDRSDAEEDCYPSQCTHEYRSAPNRTNPQDPHAPT
ncbi:hypothetical protein EYF80_063541 [Liparis tanakae]|uniref:Uncharacterized protein n=1 Tax=Liparis tanakae TaxID=230148 RepID=A0A4Z2EDH0_9TELE|nr:hypothetical protein EYF80_063541 [Liparis tanakae]